MRATVCELPDERDAFERQWPQLVQHVRDAASQLVLLPDMPFCEWFANSRRADATVWEAAVRAHDAWEQKLPELAPALVLASRPVDFGNERYDEGFLWDREQGWRSVHVKSNVAGQESGEWAWYHSAVPDFVPIEVRDVRIGFLIGAEIGAEDEARRYGREDVDLLAMPRCTRAPAFATWLAHARTAALHARAYVLSSNRSDGFGGQGWIIAPDAGVLGLTSAAQPFLSLDLELSTSRSSAQPREPWAALWMDRPA